MSFNKRFIFQVKEGDIPPVPKEGITYYISYEGDHKLYYIDYKGIIRPIYDNINSSEFDFSAKGATTITVGGIEKNTTFTAPISSQEMWELALWPYQTPEFSNFIIQGQSTILEVGETVSGANRNFIWETLYSENIQPNIIEIRDTDDGNIILGSSLNNDGNEILTFRNITKNTKDIHRFHIQGVNTDLELFGSYFTIEWQKRIFYGNETNNILNEIQLKGLSDSILSNSAERDYVFEADAGNYKNICVPDDLPYLTTFIDINTNFIVPFQDPYTVSITNDFGVNIVYNVYRSVNKLGGAITIRAKN